MQTFEVEFLKKLKMCIVNGDQVQVAGGVAAHSLDHSLTLKQRQRHGYMRQEGPGTVRGTSDLMQAFRVHRQAFHRRLVAQHWCTQQDQLRHALRDEDSDDHVSRDGAAGLQCVLLGDRCLDRACV